MNEKIYKATKVNGNIQLTYRDILLVVPFYYEEKLDDNIYFINGLYLAKYS